MEYELNVNTFFVKEALKPNLTKNGLYYYYTLEKKGLSHKQILKRVPRDSFFCGKKDRNATTLQYFCTQNEIDEINEDNLKIKFIGESNEKLFIGKHTKNEFRVLVKLSPKEVLKLKKMNKELVGNYFGEQRFDSRIDEFFNFLEKEDYENALKLFLTKESKFDTEKSTEIKNEIFKNWGKWNEIFKSEVIPDSKRAIFECLENEHDFRKAFEYVEKKSLKEMLRAIQAKRFNQELEKLMKTKNCKGMRATKALARELIIQPTNFEKQFGLRRLTRKTFFEAKKLKLKESSEKGNYWLNFNLPKGSYATIYLKFLKEQVETK